MEDILIFTEAYNCGLILKKCLESFHEFHNNKVVIFGTPKDFEYLTPHPNNVLYDISNHSDIIEGYTRGHNGTAQIFAKVINDTFTDKNKVIHFDSDTIFRGECISLIAEKLNEGHGLVGPYRCYKNNLNGRTDLGNLRDVVQTYIFGFNKTFLNKSNPYLVGMCEGGYNPLGHAILDFFDPVSFQILSAEGGIYFLDYNDYGGMNADGNKTNFYGEINHKIDFGHKIIHFAGVGSGMSYYNNPGTGTYGGYIGWAKSQYVIYQKLFYDENFPGEYDHQKYEIIKQHL
jgi:hypothetical protein